MSSASSFLVRPEPFSDESLSSWRQRTAWANGYRLFPVNDNRTRRTDPDCELGLEETAWLSDLTRCPHEQIRSMFIRSKPSMRSLNADRDRHLLWVTHSKPVAGMGAHGAMYCPDCLKSDRVPYFRWHWRLALLNECPLHRTRNLDQCPNCERPPWPAGAGVNSHIDPSFQNFGVCWACGFHLSEGPRSVHPAQCTEQLFDQINSPTWTLGQTTVSAQDALLCLRTVCHLFLRNRPREQIALSGGEWAKTASSLSADVGATNSIENIPVADRSFLVPVAFSIIHSWPDSFLEFAKECRISRAHFNGSESLMPTWMSETVDNHLAKQNRNVNPDVLLKAVQDWTEKHERTPRKTDIRKLLRWQGINGMRAAFPRRSIASQLEWEHLLVEIHLQGTESSLRSDRRIAYLRDILMLTICALLRRSIKDVSAMPLDTIRALMNSSGASDVLTETFHIQTSEIEGKFFEQNQAVRFERVLQKRLRSLMSSMPEDLVRSPQVFRGHMLGTLPS